ncbi:MAG: hypothetical protein QUS14_08055 [Pyrinomonadaceae bacterium]|nr:hypothetical protein [Pyrinomonadaceae bacterium]
MKQKNETVNTDAEDLIIAEPVTGDLLEAETANEIEIGTKQPPAEVLTFAGGNTAVYRYIVLPLIFLTVALLGGLRIAEADGAFIFLRPALLHLIFAVVLLVLFVRAGLIRIDGWFAEEFPLAKNAANASVMVALFAATTQLFNSLTPEQGLPFWVVAFCFFWTLWNNLFAEFDTKRLLRSLGGLFGIAFVAKYMLLANLTAPTGESWLRRIIENPAQEAFTWLLDLPRFAASTGYIQFFAVLLFLLGLYLLPATTRSDR